MINKKKSILIMLKTFFVISIIGALAIAGGINKHISETKHIVLNDGETIQCFKTKTVTVDEFLKEKDISVRDYDIVKPALSTNIEKNQSIDITRAKEVQVFADGQDLQIFTCEETVQELFQDENIELGENDKINYSLDTPIVNNMNIKITRVKIDEETLEESIPYNIEEVPNNEMDFGRNKVVKKGKEGLKLRRYRVKYHDGDEVNRTFLGEEIVSEPVEEIIEYGTVKSLKTSRGEVLRYTKVLDMRATAYDLSVESCGKEPDHPLYGITYTGMKARYGVVAVDPKTIPLYTRLYIESADGSWAYGKAVAGDIGGAVKGDIIDLFYDDVEFVNRFGVKRVKVYILK